MNVTTPHTELIELPPTLENLNIKLNYLITRFEVSQDTNAKLAEVGAGLLLRADAARTAAEASANIATRLIQRTEPLTKFERFVAVGLGGVLGGASVGLVTAAALMSFLLHR